MRMLHTYKVPVFGDAAEATHVLGISEDITQQKELEQVVARLNAALSARAEDLEATNKSLESFTSAASHDLRSPLSVIAGYAGLLEKGYADRLDDKGLHYLSVIRARVKSMARLIDDLLSFSRLTLQEVRKTAVDMNLLVAQVAADMPGVGPERRGRRSGSGRCRTRRPTRPCCARCGSTCCRMPSSTAAASPPRTSRSAAASKAQRPFMRCATTAPASTWRTTTNSSRCSSACTATRSSKAPVSAWPPCAA